MEEESTLCDIVLLSVKAKPMKFMNRRQRQRWVCHVIEKHTRYREETTRSHSHLKRNTQRRGRRKRVCAFVGVCVCVSE